MEEMYFNEVSHNTNEEPGHEEYQSPVEQSSISTSDLIQKETHLLIEQNIKSNIHIQQLLSNISEATETIDSQRNEILNLQTKFEGITELYKLEISKREEVDEKISYMKRISEASLKELNTLLQRANDIEKDKAQLDTIITNYQERTECIGNDQATIQNGQMENENLKSKIQNLEENLEQLVKQLDENKKISDEQLENCKTKLAETETMLQEALNEKLKITTQFEEIEKNLAVQVENAAKLNETITQLKKENQDFNERNEKISSEIIKAKTMEKSLTEDLNNLQIRFNEVSKNLEISTNLLVINDLNNNLDVKDTYINQLKTKTVHLQNEIDDLKSRIKNQQNIIDQKSTEFE
ncbi:putative leucine-rich repeat-containing protein DDB_G0290503 [Chrysoperla carnea]|uniref:putative leucine-rich repeat-containing protein DDB_G0290503 n=1 Tax=Chrysoperla carnea TaxID=189513 RepID=UPI001D09913F|nr:putative leucine-rich repeat-containing protein DDB_G0290503 [Chrysoperla carnea]